MQTANRWITPARHGSLIFAAVLVTACGGGGSGVAAQPSAVAIDTYNAQTITRDVLQMGLYTGDFGTALNGGGILSADGGSNALALHMAQRKTIQAASLSAAGSVQPGASYGPDREECLVDGWITLSASLRNTETLSIGDRITANFDACDDGDGAIYDGRIRLDVLSFSGDIFADQYLLDTRATLTSLAITEDGSTTTGDGSFDLGIDLRTPLLSRLSLDGTLLNLHSGSEAWVLRNFTIFMDEDDRGAALLTSYSGSGSLESPNFSGTVNFATTVALLATDDNYPATGALQITGANGTGIQVTVLNSETVQLAIDATGDGIVDETRQINWDTLTGGL